MPKADPLTPLRRKRFQDFCRSKKWVSDADRWAVKDISAAIGKPTNKVSDLLNGNGSFGSKIAREIEGALGLPDFYFDSLTGEFEDWRNKASPRSQAVIDLLTTAAKLDKLTEADWVTIEQLATRFMQK